MKIGVRTWVLIIFLLLSLLSIGYRFNHDGVAIVYIQRNSSAAAAGMTYDSSVQPINLELIQSINGHPVHSVAEFYNLTKNVLPGEHLYIKTNKKSYDVTILSYRDNKTNETHVVPLGITVEKPPLTNLRFGMDISGGVRVLLKPVNKTSYDNLSLAQQLIENRLNVYGLQDVKVKIVKDFSGQNYIVVEIAGKTISNIQSLLSSQGKFTAKLDNKTVFIGGKKDIKYVARAPPKAGFDPSACPVPTNGGYSCRFNFAVTLSSAAANRFFQVAKTLPVVTNSQGQKYLNSSLDLYIDGHLVDSLKVGAGLKSSPTADVSVSGAGFGKTVDDAKKDALQNMRKLQTILETGSLPVKLKIVQVDDESSKLGSAFLKNALLLAIIAIVSVAIILSLRYHDYRVLTLVMLTMLSELIIVLGFSTWIRWSLDLTSIAGLLVSIGTGVDDQIVIVDELENKKKKEGLKDKLANAFFIIFGSYFTTFVAMIPLFWAGAGMLKGFAFTTILGVTVGVFITRPAFAELLKNFVKKDQMKNQ